MAPGWTAAIVVLMMAEVVLALVAFQRYGEVFEGAGVAGIDPLAVMAWPSVGPGLWTPVVIAPAPPDITIPAPRAPIA